MIKHCLRDLQEILLFVNISAKVISRTALRCADSIKVHFQPAPKEAGRSTRTR